MSQNLKSNFIPTVPQASLACFTGNRTVTALEQSVAAGSLAVSRNCPKTSHTRHSRVKIRTHWENQFVPMKIPTLRPSLAIGAPAKTLLRAQVVKKSLQFLPSALERDKLRREGMQTKASRMVRGTECLSWGRRLLIYFAQRNTG